MKRREREGVAAPIGERQPGAADRVIEADDDLIIARRRVRRNGELIMIGQDFAGEPTVGRSSAVQRNCILLSVKSGRPAPAGA